jgi:hypothetical protein
VQKCNTFLPKTVMQTTFRCLKTTILLGVCIFCTNNDALLATIDDKSTKYLIFILPDNILSVNHEVKYKHPELPGIRLPPLPTTYLTSFPPNAIPGNKSGTKKAHSLSGPFLYLAGRLGFEPRLEASEATVLPLDDLPKVNQPIQTGRHELQSVQFSLKTVPLQLALQLNRQHICKQYFTNNTV